MAGKNKNKRKHHHNNNHSESNNSAPKLNQQQLADLFKQAAEIHQLLNNRFEALKKQKNQIYILSAKWLKQWKQYVGYEQMFTDIKEGEDHFQKKNKKMGARKPGKINDNLLISHDKRMNEYFEIPEQLEQYEYLNKIINDKFELDDEYIAITQQLWTKFTQIYTQFQQIKRPLRIVKPNKAYVDGSLLKCDFLLIDYTIEDFGEAIHKVSNKKIDQLLPCKKLQFSELWNLTDLYSFLRKFSLVNSNTDQITIWLAENFVGSRSLQQMFVQNYKNNSNKMQARLLNEDDEKYVDLDIDSILKQQYILIIEIGDTLIKTAALPDQIHGYCQECLQKKKLVYQCICGTMHYCSQQCRVDDQVWHYKTCNDAYDSEDDEIYLKKKHITNKCKTAICGLKNLGNTCYMNSSIQLIMCLDFLVQILGNNKYKKMISQTQDDAEIFLNKLSKFVKVFGEQKKFDIVVPWSLKSQVNNFMTPFRGYKQHDAIDFISGFLNTVSQCLDKKEIQALHHEIFKKNMMGNYDSLVICPQCGLQVKNLEDFMQISLPIKPKTNKTLLNYVVFNSPTKYTYGKAQALPNWNKIFNTLGMNKNKPPSVIFCGKQTQQSFLQVDTSIQPQKFVKKHKKDLLIYPNQILQSEDDILLNVSFVTTKIVCNQPMRAIYGYPFVMIINGTKSLAHLIMNLVTKIYKFTEKQEIYREKFKQFETQYDKISSKIHQLSIVQSIEAEQLEQQNKKIEKLTLELAEYLLNLKIKLYVEDLKKVKNICHFCNKKCSGCQLSPNFGISCTKLFEHKQKDTKLFIQLPQRPQFIKQNINYADNGDSKLQECLVLFSDPQQLDQQNAWYCSSCEDLRLAYKQISINIFPKYLLIQLNRFKNGAHGKVKNNQPISYEDIQRFGGNSYHLESVIVHEGSIEGGHYWSIIWKGDGYYIFNDEKVSKTEKYCNKNAYILLYKQTQDEKEKMNTQTSQSLKNHKQQQNQEES